MRYVAKRLLAVIISIISMVAILLGSLYIYRLQSSAQNDFTVEPQIVVDEDITIILGEQYQLTPYLINENNEIEAGRYKYKSGSKSISISDQGLIKPLAIPNLAESYIEINELDTRLTKRINISVVAGIGTIFDITNLNGATILRGNSCSFRVDMLPEDANINDYFSYDFNNGEKIDGILVPTISKNVISFEAKGLGKGTLNIHIKSESDLIDFNKSFDFDIIIPNNDIYKGLVEEEPLYSEAMLNRVRAFKYAGGFIDINELSMLASLEKIYFTSDKLIDAANIRADLLYYFDSSLIAECYCDELWGEHFDKIEPFDKNDITKRFVIYQNDKATGIEKIDVAEVNSSFKLKNEMLQGYINDSWSYRPSLDGPVATEEQIKAPAARAIRLYAIWDPISYEVEYHTTINSEHAYTIAGISSFSASYDKPISIPGLEAFDDGLQLYKNKGYSFVGFKRGLAETLFLENDDISSVDYLAGEDYANLTSENAQRVILYDVWKPISYNITFNQIPGILEHEKINKEEYPASVSLFYSETYRLPLFTTAGYKISGFKNPSNGNEYLVNSELRGLTTSDGANIILNPIYTENEYRLKILTPKDNKLTALPILVESEILTFKYTAAIELNSLSIGQGVADYGWYLNTNKDSLEYDSADAMLDDPLHNNIASIRMFNQILADNGSYIDEAYNEASSQLTIRPYAINSSYDVIIGSNGGVIKLDTGMVITDEQSMKILESTSIAIKSASRRGHLLMGYEIRVNDGAEITINTDLIRISNLGIFGIDDNNNIIGEPIGTSDKDVIKIMPIFKASRYTIVYKEDKNRSIIFGDIIPLPEIAKDGYSFMGWCYDSTCSRLVAPETSYDFAENIILYPKWEKESYKVEFDLAGGGFDRFNTPREEYYYQEKLPEPTKTGNTFLGYRVNGVLIHEMPDVNNTSELPTTGFKLKAEWSVNTYYMYFYNFYDISSKVTFESNGKSITCDVWCYTPDCKGDDMLHITCGAHNVAVKSDTPMDSDNKARIPISYGTAVKYEWKYELPKDNKLSLNYIGGGAVEYTELATRKIMFIMGAADIKVSGDSNDNNCVAEGTLVALANGSTKRVEDIKENDILRVFNHETGKYEASKISLIIQEPSAKYMVTYLDFSNGVTTRLLSEHAYFDLTLNKYVYITNNNFSEFIGHSFAFDSLANAGYSASTLVRGYNKQEEMSCYEIVTYKNLNFIADGLISVSGGIDLALFNIFEFDNATLVYDQAKMNEDIEKYGLYSFEDFKAYVPYEIYDVFNAKYFKASVGKGLISYEDIISLANKFMSFLYKQ